MEMKFSIFSIICTFIKVCVFKVLIAFHSYRYLWWHYNTCWCRCVCPTVTLYKTLYCIYPSCCCFYKKRCHLVHLTVCAYLCTRHMSQLFPYMFTISFQEMSFPKNVLILVNIFRKCVIILPGNVFFLRTC